jgi:hypothetical protein
MHNSENAVCFQEEAREFSALESVQTGSGVEPSLLQNLYQGFSAGLEQPERKTLIRLVPGLRMCGDMVPFAHAFPRLGTGPIHLHVDEEFAMETT